MAFSPSQIGSYLLICPVAKDSFFESYIGRNTADSVNPEKLISIKVLVENEKRNEADLSYIKEILTHAMNLNHGNIQRILRIQQIDKDLLIAQEYIEGKTLNKYQNNLLKRGVMFSIEMSCHIVRELCLGLDYARKGSLIQGGLAPFNFGGFLSSDVIISYTGSVTLSPLAVVYSHSNQRPDLRPDIHSIGVILWELLTARSFHEENSNGSIPPSQFNPKVPKQLDKIVSRCLLRHVEDSFADADSIQRELNKFIYSFNIRFNPQDLEYYAKEIWAKQIIDDNEWLNKHLEQLEP